MIENFLSLYLNFITINKQFLKINLNEGHYYIYNSIFSTLYSNLNGGAISYQNTINSINTKLFSSSCVFNKCIANNKGGAIYFSCPFNGFFLLDQICSNNCYTKTSTGIFCQSITNSSNNNSIILSSIIDSPQISSSTSHLIYLINGFQELSNLNTSNNKAYYSSFGTFTSPYFFNLSFSNIISCTTEWSGSMIIQTGLFNIIRNLNLISTIYLYSGAALIISQNTMTLNVYNSIFKDCSPRIFHPQLGSIINVYESYFYPNPTSGGENIFSCYFQITSTYYFNLINDSYCFNNILFNCDIKNSCSKSINSINWFIFSILFF